MRKLLREFEFLLVELAVFVLIAASQLNSYLNDNKD